ncbi:MAG: TIGR03862 family flavoprotein [Hyphomicrobiaceae bacterium]
MKHVIVVGAGPAGLMAADVVSAAGVSVTVYERMASVGRKLLMAGRGGLNLTHSEPIEAFLGRYGAARAFMRGPIEAFPPAALREMADRLGQETFVGSSGRVFPRAMKASPLLRAWLVRLAGQGVEVRTHHEVAGFDEERRILVRGRDGRTTAVASDATVLALGGGSWPRLGSDGAWVDWLRGLGVSVSPLVSANAGLAIDWSPHFRDRFEGEPLKRIAMAVCGLRLKGEAIITRAGLEGGVVYALFPKVRQALGAGSSAVLRIDLRPDVSVENLAARLARPRGKQSLASWLRKAAHLSPVAIGLLRETRADGLPNEAEALARAIKDVWLEPAGLGSIERAISSAGGVALDEVGPDLMLRGCPGLFVAGEMLDWEAPTGGYLLQGCFATGHAAGRGVLRYLGREPGEVDA